MRNPDMVYVLKIEYVPKINIFGLKMMMKCGLEKIFLKFLHAQSLFQIVFFITEFVPLIKSSFSYEVNSFNRKWLAQG